MNTGCRGSATEAAPRDMAWSPPWDVYEEDTDLVVLVEVPGVAKEDVKVEMAEGIMTVDALTELKATNEVGRQL